MAKVFMNTSSITDSLWLQWCPPTSLVVRDFSNGNQTAHIMVRTMSKASNKMAEVVKT